MPVVTNIIERCVSPSTNTRHGNLLALAHILGTLKERSRELLPEELQHNIGLVVPHIEQQRLFRGAGGEMIRYGCTRLQVTITPKVNCVDSVVEAGPSQGSASERPWWSTRKETYSKPNSVPQCSRGELTPPQRRHSTTCCPRYGQKGI